MWKTLLKKVAIRMAFIEPKHFVTALFSKAGAKVRPFFILSSFFEIFFEKILVGAFRNFIRARPSESLSIENQ
jgi:hypothetical protein